MPPEVETHLVNAVLTNGARYYVDHAHPESPRPSAPTPARSCVYDRAAELILQRVDGGGRARCCPTGQEIVVYKNNSDGKGNCYGCHENYLMDRAVPFGRIVTHVMPHFVTRQIFTGAGKVGTRGARACRAPTCRSSSRQRADFFEEEVGLETTLKRPIVNTRDEPHADAQKYRRLHVIVGDANLSEVATFLKVGTTAIVLAMIEDDVFAARLRARHARCRRCARCRYDLTLRRPLELADGPTVTALEMQWELLRPGPQVRRGARPRVRSARTVGAEVLRRWEAGARRPRDRPDVAGRPARLGGQVPAARRLPRAPRPRAGTTPGWRRWTCSTTTSARRSRSPPGSGCERIVDRRRGRARR